jgi:hypothetical protein
MKLLIEQKIKDDKLDAAEVKGKIGLRCGTVLAFISATTPDDPVKLGKLQKAAKEVLNINM